MKYFLKIFLLFLVSLYGCKHVIQTVDHEGHILSIEQNLLPGIAIEGEEKESFNISDRMRHFHVPGVSIAFFDRGEIQWTKCYGFLSLDSLKRVDEQTLFQAASISKPVAATGALTLVEEGLLDLDRPVNDFLKGWKIPDNQFTSETKVSFRHLITHTGGLTVHGFRGYASDEDVPDVVQILNGEAPANSDPIFPDTEPGTLWRYSGGGYTIAQKVMEDVTGQPFHQILKERVLSKIGMKNSTYEQPLPESLHENAAKGYRGDGSMVDGKWHTYPEQAAAGLWTTPSDLARLAISVQKSFMGSELEVLSPETAKAMLTKNKGDWGLGFGLNGSLDSLRFGHGGANEGYRCTLMAFAGLGQGVVIMTNGDSGGALYEEILRSISNEYDWNIYQQEIKKTIALSDEEQLRVVGNYKYEPDVSFSITIEMKEGNLILHQLWNSLSYPIVAEDSLLFFDKNEGTSFQFAMGNNRKIEKVIVDGGFELIKMEE